MSQILTQLVAELNAGALKVVDLTQPLGPSTPVIGLPPIFASSPGVTIEQISRYDQAGPGWYWNTLHLGEHTGTHFDAPVHWITGKELPDNRCDTIPARRFVGPACVIDVTTEVAQNPDFLLTPERIVAWETEHGRIPAGAWVLLRTGWSARSDPAAVLNVGPDGPHRPGFDKAASALLAHERDVLAYGTAQLEAIPGLRLVGTAAHKVGVLSFLMDGAHPSDVGTILDQVGVAVRTGHHCTQPLMDRFGIPATARASMALYSTRADIDGLVRGLHLVREMFA
mgnify:CR=1 FL=1